MASPAHTYRRFTANKSLRIILSCVTHRNNPSESRDCQHPRNNIRLIVSTRLSDATSVRARSPTPPPYWLRRVLERARGPTNIFDRARAGSVPLDSRKHNATQNNIAPLSTRSENAIECAQDYRAQLLKRCPTHRPAFLTPHGLRQSAVPPPLSVSI